MTKTRKKKNYKLRRRVKRTIAALIMIMAVVVAAIPVENLGTTQAAGEGAWNESSGNAYSATEKLTNALDDSGYTAGVKTVQSISNMILTNPLTVKLKTSNNASEAIIVSFDSSQVDSTGLDIKEKMFYNYVKYDKTTVDGWVSALRDPASDEYYELTFSKSTGKRIERDNDWVALPNKFNIEQFTYSDGTKTETTKYNNLKTYKSDFNEKKVFTDSDAFFRSEYDSYVNVIKEYNAKVEGLESFNTTNITDAEWAEFRDKVSDLQAIYDEKYNTSKEYASLKIKLSDVDFTLKPSFYFESFCNRVSYTQVTPELRLNGFILEQAYDGANGNNDIYLVKWNESDRTGIGEVRKELVDEAGYLAAGYVYIKGIGENAFKDSQITRVSLPNSIRGIGDSAFENSRITTLEFNPRWCEKIGNRAFYNCDRLKEINLTNENASGDDANQSSITEIGAEAFYGTGITNIEFPDTLTKIYDGCFAESALKQADFSRVSGALTIGAYAFYNCDLGDQNSSGVVFPPEDKTGTSVTIKKAAFSIPYGYKNSMGVFEFPSKMTKIDNDYILAGRTNLSHVVFPADLNGEIKKNTLANCENLECVTLGKISYNDKAGSMTQYENGDSSTIFADVTNEAFYVEGPGFLESGSTPTCRKNTIELKAGQNTSTTFYVPYKYIDKQGITRIEQKQESTDSTASFVAEIEVTDETSKTAQLTKYSGYGANVTITVPSNVAGYRVTSLGKGCFDEVKNTMEKLIIADNTISEIGNEALKNADNLKEVIIGNSVRMIGTDAFADCPKLTSVTFNEPMGINEGDWVSAMDSIGDGAFKTNSTSLVFHGVIHDGYAPFEYAMSAENAGFTNQKAGKNICYKSNEPDSLSVIRDNVTGLSTLVDYPNAKNVSSTVIAAFAAFNDPNQTHTEEQAALINGVLNISVSDGIDSIDVKKYFSEDNNKENKEYIVKPDGSSYIDTYINDSDNTIAGLFSGDIQDNGANLLPMTVSTATTTALSVLGEDTVELNAGNIDRKPGDYTEYITKGNDHLTSIVLGDDVEGMPEKYAFDSCENLTKVTLGAKVSDLGKMPFKGCKSLEDVSSNAFYKCENGILYKVGDDGTFNTITECLESRGDINGPLNNSVIDVKSDPAFVNVTNICEEAFSDCLNLSEIDFTGTGVTGIPKDCFKGDKNLRSIILPETISFVEEGAFADLSNGASDLTKVVLKIYDANCYINSNAIDNTTKYLVYGYEFADSKNTKKSAVYNFCQAHSNVEFKALEPGYTVTFRNYDGKMIDEVTGITDSSQRIVPPDMEEYLKTNPYDGHIFVDWLWTDSTGADHIGTEAYSNIAEDRDVYATYKLDPGEYVFTGEDVDIEIVNGTLNGNGTMNDKKTTITIASGKDIYITADTIKDKTFSYWSVSDDLDIWVNNLHDKQTTFTVPNPPTSGKITITANFLNTPGSGGGSGSGEGGGTGGGGTGGGGSSTDTTTKYKVTVNYGTGSGEYKAGDTVNISALAPDTSTKVFSKWTSATSGVGFANATSATTSFIMPASDVTVTANYKTRSSDDDSDSDRGSSSSSRPGSSSTTNTVSNRPSSSTSTTGTTGTVTNTTNGNTTGNNNNNNGNKLYITKNGVSNKDVGSVSVNGSNDNFIVKISDSDEATAAVKEALTNKYGSLDGLAYFPMDISLYDSTGQNKITDTYGLNITVTMPIPDVLIQYGGNARVAAADNGNLQQLTPKFTTIDGIACISFVPPHFSPYVIYVDTNNLVAGQTLDSTPSTGDPIHPKWFAAIGMACISIILFATSDGHKRRKYKAA